MVSRIHVLTKNYKYIISYISFCFVYFGKPRFINIPYWITKSNVTPELRKEMRRLIEELRGE